MAAPNRSEPTRSADDVRDEAHLCLEFQRVIDALTRRYGVINVADRCRIFADLIERAEAGFNVKLEALQRVKARSTDDQ